MGPDRITKLKLSGQKCSSPRRNSLRCVRFGSSMMRILWEVRSVGIAILDFGQNGRGESGSVVVDWQFGGPMLC